MTTGNKRRLTGVLLTAGVLLTPGPGAAQTDGETVLQAAAVPEQGQRAADFVPAGWQIESQLADDLDGDGRGDLVIALIQRPKPDAQTADFPPSRSRALVIALQKSPGHFVRVGFSARVLQCTACGGAFYGVMPAPAKVSLVDKVILVSQDHGSRNLVDELYRFRYSASRGRFELIGYDLHDHDRLTGDDLRESSNFLIGLKLITRSRYDPASEKLKPVTQERRRIPRRLLALEQVDRDMTF